MNFESSPNGSSLPSYRFGSFELDPSERRLKHDETGIELTPKAFDTLLLLVQNSSRLLEKEYFMRTLWPDSVVEEANLAHYISQLRKVLQEKSPGEQFIETVPKVGYRFVARVEVIPAVEPPAPGQLPRDE
ncbi:MAG TPA: winged helix-turn-helix domain-containing protein [Acidobacteriota bacterium]|nr:winged helix-turn-helix domain-containing protein [Acidobacteriota bacterium]